MSAREAYIAGRSGGSRPPKQTSPSSTQRNTQQDREQQAFTAGQAEKERAVRAQVTKDKGTGRKVEGGLTPDELKQAKTIAQNVAKQGQFKDPYNVLTREQEIDAGYPKTAIEKLKETTGIGIPALSVQAMVGGAKAFQALLDRAFKPEAKDFSNPNFLAVLNAEFKKGKAGGGLDKSNYTKKYQKLINEAYGSESEDFLEAQGFNVSGEDLFNQKLATTESDAFFKNLNPSVQFNVDPSRHFKKEGYKIPQTVDGLERLAKLDAQKYLQEPNYDAKLSQMILNARDESARQKGERTKYTGLGSYMGEEPVAGGAGIPSLATVPTPFTDINNNGILDNLEVAQATTTPTTATTTPGVPSLTPTSLTPTTIDYASMAPQFGSQYPGYKNQGVASPQLGDWYQNLNKYYT